MKTLRLVSLIVVLAFSGLVAGCCGPSNAVLVKGVSGYTDVILPEYEAYIKADAKLAEATKKIRLDSAAGLRRLLEAATPPK